jgi:hypothetical protein
MEAKQGTACVRALMMLLIHTVFAATHTTRNGI